ncbi:MAG: hypothetical protein ACOYIQ_02430 [Christensenellales bacterium]|jgi:hypothetical protein
MIIKIDKLIFKDDGDCIIRYMDGRVFCHIAKVANGYYIYNVKGEQIAQMLFGKKSCDLVLANPYLPKESSYTLHLLKNGNFAVTPLEIDELRDRRFIERLQKEQEVSVLNKAEFTLVGDFREYNYDIYRGSIAAGNVLPHEDDAYFKVRINEGGNIVRVMMLALAIDRLCFEKPRDRKVKKKIFKYQHG